MSQAVAEPGSFRDPSGRVYRRDGRIFRTVLEPAVADFEFVRSTGLLQRLARDGLALAAEPVNASVLGDLAAGARYVLEQPKIPFISYPYEWSFLALKSAALCHLEVHLEALDHGVTLSDASAYNVQFEGARPVFIDALSFRHYRDGDLWVGHRQFCEQFLNPLLLRATLGIPHNAWYRGSPEGIGTVEFKRLLPLRRKLSWNVLTHVVLQATFQKAAEKDGAIVESGRLERGRLPLAAYRRMLKRLHKWIEGLKPADSGKTPWAEYPSAKSYSAAETKAKKAFIRDFASAVRPGMVWDLGCNTGDFSEAALEAGAGYAVGFDADQGALDKAFARAEAENLAFLPLYLDAANPSPSQGWEQRERQGLMERASADAVLALALVHHLAIARNIPLDRLLGWLVDLAAQGVVEFVPKSDPMVQRMLRLREDIFEDYTEEHFLHCLRERARIIKSETVTPEGRRLIWYSGH